MKKLQMHQLKISTHYRKLLADTLTPVSIFLNVRKHYSSALLLESCDYHGNENSMSFLCFDPLATYLADKNQVTETFPDGASVRYDLEKKGDFNQTFSNFIKNFDVTEIKELPVNGIFGYSSFDAVQYFESIKFENPISDEYKIPDLQYSLYRYIVAINHFTNTMYLIENTLEGEDETLDHIASILFDRPEKPGKFKALEDESSNITDEEFKQLVTHGKEHCARGDVFQIVFSRQFSCSFEGDDINLYRALRSINPSPYLFYFDYGDFRIMGSSPEAQIVVKENKATINPIAGTFKRTGDDMEDRVQANNLFNDPKENSEHVMLVDLARNDVSRHANNVTVDKYREIQFYSHVIHMVSTVTGDLFGHSNGIDMMASTFPAGTLSGAPKYKALELIDKYENQARGIYGGALGFIGFDGTVEHAITIRTFLSKNQQLFYQAGAGVVIQSKEESELQEVNNKLGALKKAITMAQNIE